MTPIPPEPMGSTSLKLRTVRGSNGLPVYDGALRHHLPVDRPGAGPAGLPIDVLPIGYVVVGAGDRFLPEAEPGSEHPLEEHRRHLLVVGGEVVHLAGVRARPQ